jgi:hypothetical protein
VAVEAGVVQDDLGGTVLAAVEVTCEGGGAAAFEIVEDAALGGRESVVLSKRPAVGAHDGVDLEARRTGGWVRVHGEGRVARCAA